MGSRSLGIVTVSHLVSLLGLKFEPASELLFEEGSGLGGPCVGIGTLMSRASMAIAKAGVLNTVFTTNPGPPSRGHVESFFKSQEALYEEF